MSTPQDPKSPLLSALTNLKSRVAKEEKRNWREHTGTLSAEDYPELNIRSPKPAPEEVAAEEVSREEPLSDIVQGGGLRKLEAADLGPVFQALLAGGHLGLFIQSVDQMRAGLDSSAPDDRRWALESVRTLIALEDLSLVPYGTLPLLLDCVGRLLVKEERVELRDASLEISALLLGMEAAQGDLESVHSHLAWLERAARGRGAEYSSRILASRNLVLPALAVLFREGHGALENRVLPFFRFVGEAGARTLTQLLDEEQNRQRRNRILELLKLLGPASIPALKEGLVAGSWHLVRNALNLVGDLEEPQAFEYVVPCLDHPEPRVVKSAVRALWKTGGSRAERYLLELLPRTQADIQSEILEGLGRIGTGQSVPPLAVLAGAGPERLRLQALGVLGQLKHLDAIPLLESLLKRKGRIFKTSEPMPIRLAAARALLAIGTMEARRILDQAVAEEPRGPGQEELRKAATGAGTWG